MNSKQRKMMRESLWFKRPICFVCQKEISNFADCTLEHVLPKSLGGNDKKYNLGISHRLCNHLRGNTMCRLLWQERLNEIHPNIDWKNRVYRWKVRLGYVQSREQNSSKRRDFYCHTNLQEIMKAWREKYQLNEEEAV
jgi:HNH endonuclease